ncbi:MAG: CcmD family protein [Deltaproteobacteria bacterium]|jgi:CcmD family protein|nr:CcmD family protein [Deltaproteobacteria bacterium]
MDKTTWLMYACMVVWAGFGLYLFMIARRQKNLERRIEQLAIRADEE